MNATKNLICFVNLLLLLSTKQNKMEIFFLLTLTNRKQDLLIFQHKLIVTILWGLFCFLVALMHSYVHWSHHSKKKSLLISIKCIDTICFLFFRFRKMLPEEIGEENKIVIIFIIWKKRMIYYQNGNTHKSNIMNNKWWKN